MSRIEIARIDADRAASPRLINCLGRRLVPPETDPEAVDAPDPWLRPAWEDTPDETDADRVVRRPKARLVSPGGAAYADAAAVDLAALLTPLSDAADALGRLDARAAAAGEAIRDGLVTRMAFAEAAGFLAHAHAWVHPLDLCLRDLGLTGSVALTATGSGRRVLPQTFRAAGGAKDWTDPSFDRMAGGDRIVADAIALARALRQLPGRGATTLFGSAITAAETLGALGAGWLDPAAFTTWWKDHAPVSAPSRGRHGAGWSPPLPPLLIATWAAKAWLTAGLTAQPAPHLALFSAAALLTRSGATRAVFLPVWAAYPAAGFGDRDALPTLRTDAAARVAGEGRPVHWPLVFLHLVAESARAGLRELDRLEVAAEKGRGVIAGCDKRARLPHALDALLRAPVLTPKALAGRLKVAPQTGTALLRELEGRGVVREVTGRGSFRAFAL
jgi:hypothetical protein